MSRPPHLHGIHHLALMVEDLDVSDRFYSEILNLKQKTKHRDAEGRHRSTWYTCGESLLMLEHHPTPTPSTAVVAFTIQPEMRESWIKRLQVHHIPIQKETAYTVYFSDPSGHTIALSHYPKKISPKKRETP